MRRWLWLIALSAGALFLMTLSVYAGTDTEQQKFVNDYVKAYARKDRAKIRNMVPEKAENLFGPYPFVGTPTLKAPKVDDNQALIEFTGKVVDDKFPDRGGILCYRQDKKWLVRQVLFYEKVPALFNLPKKSVTDEDKKYESAVAALGERFITHWKQGNTEAIVKECDRWMDRDSDPIKGLSLSNFSYESEKTRLGDAFAIYKTKLTYKWGILSYTMDFDGGLILVKENGEWKVRGNIMVLYF